MSHLSCCMEGNVLGIMEESHVEDEHEKSSYLQVLVKEDTIEYMDQTLVSLQKYIQEDIPFRSASKYTYLSKDWISEYIVEIETQGCTCLACKCKEYFLRHALEEGTHDLPIWKGDFTSEDVADYIPCRSENKSVYLSIEWVDRCLIEIDTLGGNVFLCLCNEVFLLLDIALTWVQQPRSIMKLPSISYYHPSMAHNILPSSIMYHI